MKEILTISIAVVILTINLIPFFIAFGVLFPARTAKTVEAATRLPGRSFVVGMINFTFFLVFALALFSLSDRLDGLLKTVLILPALVISIILSIMLGAGLGSMAVLVGERLVPAQSLWKRLFWGTLVLGLGSSVPLLGWFLLLPYAAWVGMGAFIIGFFQKNTT
jgi:hypothetical protein